ncbi:MAG: adenosine kinase [Actinomycetota bacterium]|nr:adenosine kinase [Actinomycetota bacterium]
MHRRATPELLTVGHALVDVLARVDDAVVAGLGLEKGTMNLVDPARSAEILAAVRAEVAVSGGSAANTAAGVAALGGSVAFVGKVRDDEWGRLFAGDIRAAGVVYAVPVASEGPATGQSVVLVTPDGEKTMCTSLGIGDQLGAEDVDVASVSEARIVYLEGYLCGVEHTAATVEAVLASAEAGGTAVSLSLSDPLWVRLHRAELLALLPQVDLLFANADEAAGMAGTSDPRRAARELAETGRTVVVTLGAEGSVVISGGRLEEVPAVEAEVVDTTGAGDLFAAGYLRAHLGGATPLEAARLGSVAAAEVVGHLGARPVGDLRALARAAGLASLVPGD